MKEQFSAYGKILASKVSLTKMESRPMIFSCKCSASFVVQAQDFGLLINRKHGNNGSNSNVCDVPVAHETNSTKSRIGAPSSACHGGFTPQLLVFNLEVRWPYEGQKPLNLFPRNCLLLMPFSSNLSCGYSCIFYLNTFAVLMVNCLEM